MAAGAVFFHQQSDLYVFVLDLNALYPQESIPFPRIGFRILIPSEKQRNVGVIPFLGQTWIFSVS